MIWHKLHGNTSAALRQCWNLCVWFHWTKTKNKKHNTQRDEGFEAVWDYWDHLRGRTLFLFSFTLLLLFSSFITPPHSQCLVLTISLPSLLHFSHTSFSSLKLNYPCFQVSPLHLWTQRLDTCSRNLLSFAPGLFIVFFHHFLFFFVKIVCKYNKWHIVINVSYILVYTLKIGCSVFSDFN